MNRDDTNVRLGQYSTSPIFAVLHVGGTGGRRHNKLGRLGVVSTANRAENHDEDLR